VIGQHITERGTTDDSMSGRGAGAGVVVRNALSRPAHLAFVRHIFVNQMIILILFSWCWPGLRAETASTCLTATSSAKSFRCNKRTITFLLVSCAGTAPKGLSRRDVVVAVGINCTPPQHIGSLLRAVRAHLLKPVVVYPNSGEGWDAAAQQWTPPGGVPHSHNAHSVGFCDLHRYGHNSGETGGLADQVESWFGLGTCVDMRLLLSAELMYTGVLILSRSLYCGRMLPHHSR
jgi:hypothetical protein